MNFSKQSVSATEYRVEGFAPNRCLDVQTNHASTDAVRENNPGEPEQGWQRNHDGGYPLQVEAPTHKRAAYAAAWRKRAGKHASWTAGASCPL